MTTDASRYSEVRYLHAKRSVDDRALNARVLEAFAAALAGLPARPRILEVGAGVGTMVCRLAERGHVTQGQYTLLDRDAASLGAAGEHLERWGASGSAGGDRRTLSLRRPGGVDLGVELVEADVFAWLGAREEPAFDAVLANAFLDLVEVPALLPLLWRRVGPGGPFWFSINFDGETALLPELDGDAEVLRRYHRTMDDRMRDGRRAGESKTGRHLLESIPRSGARIVEAGSSDWVVWPSGGGYPDDEAYFLRHIVETIRVALDGAGGIPKDELAAWIAARHRHIDRGELVYIAHQLDVTGRAPA